jgi:hypothetical protein
VLNEDKNFGECNIALFSGVDMQTNHLLTVNKTLMVLILNSRINKAVLVCFNQSQSSSGHTV